MDAEALKPIASVLFVSYSRLWLCGDKSILSVHCATFCWLHFLCLTVFLSLFFCLSSPLLPSLYFSLSLNLNSFLSSVSPFCFIFTYQLLTFVSLSPLPLNPFLYPQPIPSFCPSSSLRPSYRSESPYGHAWPRALRREGQWHRQVR